MVNAIIAGISNSLYNEFGYENHMEEIKQDLEEPCFFISALNPSAKGYPGGRCRRDNSFVIQYFPESEDHAASECYSVAERMLKCLGLISVQGQLLHGSSMNYRVTDGVLSYFVDYNFFTRDTVKTECMGDMGYSIKGKGRW